MNESRPTIRFAVRCWIENRITDLFFGKNGSCVFRFGADEVAESVGHYTLPTLQGMCHPADAEGIIVDEVSADGLERY